MTVPTFNRKDERIESVSEWQVRASPSPGRWAEGYSAQALAEAWIRGRAAVEARQHPLLTMEEARRTQTPPLSRMSAYELAKEGEKAPPGSDR